MGAYIFLGAAALTSFFGMGLVSLACLIILYFVSESLFSGDSALNKGHHRYIRKTAGWGILVHILVTLILFGKVGYLMMVGGGFGVVAQAGVLHFILDHIAEFLLAIWLSVRAIRGVLWMNEGKLPGGRAVPAPAEGDALPLAAPDQQAQHQSHQI